MTLCVKAKNVRLNHPATEKDLMYNTPVRQRTAEFVCAAMKLAPTCNCKFVRQTVIVKTSVACTVKKLIPNPPNSIGNAFYLFNNLHHISTCCTVGEQRHNALYLCIKIGGTSCLNYKNALSVTLMLKTSKSVRCGMYRQKAFNTSALKIAEGMSNHIFYFDFSTKGSLQRVKTKLQMHKSANAVSFYKSSASCTGRASIPQPIGLPV